MINDIINEAKAKMKTTIGVFENDLQGIRGGRARYPDPRAAQRGSNASGGQCFIRCGGVLAGGTG